MTCSALPTLSEVPAAAGKEGRDIEQFLRLALIPEDDADLRAAACAVLVDSENPKIELNERGTPKHIDLLVDLSTHLARTPGGIAWKIAEALSYFDTDDEWRWWRYLLKSALIDAIELERLRNPAKAGGAA